jgi:hypothetical protein
VPNSPATVLKRGVGVSAMIQLANTGNTSKDLFVDPRTTTKDALLVGGAVATLPLPNTIGLTYFVPPETSQFDVLDQATSPNVPVLQDVINLTGAFRSVITPEFGGTVFKDEQGQVFSDATLAAPEVPFGFYNNTPAETGTFKQPAPISTLEDLGFVTTQHFDDAVTSDTNDLFAIVLGLNAAAYTPLTLAPGQSGTMHITITPTAPVGTVVHGFLYVDTASVASGFLVTGSGDEVVAIPYSYTVGS